MRRPFQKSSALTPEQAYKSGRRVAKRARRRGKLKLRVHLALERVYFWLHDYLGME